MESEAANYFLLYDSLAENGTPITVNFLEWPITMIHAKAFTLGLPVDEDGNTDESKNHWAIIIETSSRSFRVSMESRANKRTSKGGVLTLRPLRYTGQSWSSAHRETFMWQKSGTTVQEALIFIISRGCHRFEMSTTPGGAKKGCRHHF